MKLFPEHLVTMLQRISDREQEVLCQIALGYPNKEIALTLGIGIRTVETHRERIMRKLDIHSVARLTAFALATRIVSNPFLEPVKEESLSTPTLQALTA